MIRGEIQIPINDNRNSEIHEHLQSLSKKEVISLIYTNIYKTQNFSTGIISEVFENEIIINHFLPNGKYDGFVVKNISDIYKIESGSKYAEKIDTLRKLHKTNHAKVQRYRENGFLSVLDYAHSSNKVISVELSDSDNLDAVGFVRELTDAFCSILLINEYAEEDGLCKIRIENITHLSCDGDDEMTLYELFLQKNNRD